MKPFLTAKWRWLVMLNYEIDPLLLAPLVPAGTELDFWNGKTFASMVGFLFLDTKLRGLPIPFHQNFEEVNLRFYVRRKGPEGWRRAVVFVREIVPRWWIAFVARARYGEKYVAMPMRHRFSPPLSRPWVEGQMIPQSVEYAWHYARRWHRLGITVEGEPAFAGPGSEEEFITEHYWGYASQRAGGTVEYQVEHLPWRVWRAKEAWLDIDAEALYGPQFAACLSARPSSAFLAEGSEVIVYQGESLPKPSGHPVSGSSTAESS